MTYHCMNEFFENIKVKKLKKSLFCYYLLLLIKISLLLDYWTKKNRDKN